jgi:uncharacterized membrane protein (UPF0127 family)
MRQISLAFNGQLGPQQLVLLVAESAIERMRGLLARQALGRGEAMLLPSCRLIHTVGMAYPIDVVFLRRDGMVLKVAKAVVPGRASGHWRAHSVLELAAGEADRHGIACGVSLPAVGGKP